MGLPAASKGKDGFALSRIFWKTAGELHTFCCRLPHSYLLSPIHEVTACEVLYRNQFERHKVFGCIGGAGADHKDPGPGLRLLPDINAGRVQQCSPYRVS